MCTCGALCDLLVAPAAPPPPLLGVSASGCPIQAILSNATYLQNSSVTICGVKFYGAPWTPKQIINMAFSASPAELQRYWALIPSDTDVLLTHNPPFNVLDLAWVPSRTTGQCPVCGKVHPQYAHWGCERLLAELVSRVQPRVHVFGHVHDAFGAHDTECSNGRVITHVNAALQWGSLRHAPWFDFPLSQAKAGLPPPPAAMASTQVSGEQAKESEGFVLKSSWSGLVLDGSDGAAPVLKALVALDKASGQVWAMVCGLGMAMVVSHNLMLVCLYTCVE